MGEKNYSKVPVFENGLAQPVFKFTDGKTGENYDPATSSIVRYCVYVESDYDMDGDGKRDLVKAFIQVPRSAVEGSYKAATLYEARPYCAGVQAEGHFIQPVRLPGGLRFLFPRSGAGRGVDHRPLFQRGGPQKGKGCGGMAAGSHRPA